MELGFKELTPENCLEPDEMVRAFVTMDASGATHPIEQGEWAKEVLAVTLTERVPVEVHRLFAVARGAMLFGYFFYPLFALASEQLLRASETALSLKCVTLGAPGKIASFNARIRWLQTGGHLSEQEAGVWHAVRELRNSASHPRDQMILMPGQALSLLARTAEEIERLFAAEPAGEL